MEKSDKSLESRLCEFVECGNVEAFKVAIQEGALLNREGNAGVTLLHRAAQSNSTQECLKELLKSDSVDVDAKTWFGDTPLAYSCQMSSDKTLKILIEHGADVNSSSLFKLTPLHIACRNDCLKTVMLLIKGGANVNAKGNDGWTPLHTATKHGSAEVCDYLLQNGADANIPNNNDILPLHFAVRNSCEVFNLIKNNTKNDTILKYCTFPGPCGINVINRSILCLALDAGDKALTESVLKSGLPSDVLSCPVVTKKSCDIHIFFNWKEELQPYSEKLVLYTPLCFYLQLDQDDDDYTTDLEILNMLIDSNICVANTFNSSDSLYVPGPIEVELLSTNEESDKFKIINFLLENGFDVDDECNGVPAKLLKLCIMTTEKSILMLLLKASNVVEPEDILRWTMDNCDKFIPCIIQDMVYNLLVLSPYVTVPSFLCSYFETLPLCEGEHVSKKIKLIYEKSVPSLSSYCRSVVRRQLHYETKNNPRQFTEKLNSLSAPKMIISYLKFSDVKFTVCERSERVSCQIACDL